MVKRITKDKFGLLFYTCSLRFKCLFVNKGYNGEWYIVLSFGYIGFNFYWEARRPTY